MSSVSSIQPGDRPDVAEASVSQQVAAGGVASDHRREVVIEADDALGLRNLTRLWAYRELLGFLAWRDIKVRYKQTALGAVWALIQPVGLMVVITLLRRVMGMGSATDPVLVFAALLPWTFFASSVGGSTNSLVGNAGMLRKVYFPRLVLPLAAVGAPMLDYVLAFGVLVGLMLWYGTDVTWQLALIPLMVLSTVIAALGVGVLLSALTVAYRDFRYVVPFVLQVGLFLTPVIYTAGDLPDMFRWMIGLNPMGGTIEAFRAAVLGTPIDYASWAMSTAIATVCLLTGVTYFTRAERWFADLV